MSASSTAPGPSAPRSSRSSTASPPTTRRSPTSVGRGLMCAFSLPSRALRDRVLTDLREQEKVLLLGCGSRSIRFRPALTVAEADLAAGVAAVDRVLTRLEL